MELDLKYATLLTTVDSSKSKSFSMQSGEIPLHIQVTKRAQWHQLPIQTHVEPLYIAPAKMKQVSETQIILLVSGAMRMKITYNGIERHYDDCTGHLFFTAANADPYEMQWNSLTNAPIHAIHLYLNNDLLAQTAASIAGTNSLRVNLQDSKSL